MASKQEGVYSTLTPPTLTPSTHPPKHYQRHPSISCHLHTHREPLPTPSYQCLPTPTRHAQSRGLPSQPALGNQPCPPPLPPLLPLPNPHPEQHSHAPGHEHPHYRSRRCCPRIQRDTGRYKRRRGDYPRGKRRVDDGRNTRKGRRLRRSVRLDGSRGVLRVEDAAHTSIYTTQK